MTTITFSSSRTQHGSGTNTLEGIRKGLVAFFEGIREGLDMARAYNTLSRMSDRELRKRGLTRSEIAHAVATGRVR